MRASWYPQSRPPREASEPEIMPGRDTVVFRAVKRTGESVFLTAPKKVKDYYEQYGPCEVTYTCQEKQKDTGNTRYGAVIKFQSNSIANRVKQKYNAKTLFEVELSTAWLDNRQMTELGMIPRDTQTVDTDTWKDRYVSASTEPDNSSSVQKSPPPSSRSHSSRSSRSSPPQRRSTRTLSPPSRSSSRSDSRQKSPREKESSSRSAESRHSPRERTSSRSGRKERTSDRDRSDRNDKSSRSSSSQQRSAEESERKSHRKREASSSSSSSQPPPAKRAKENSSDDERKSNIFERLGPSSSQVLREKASATAAEKSNKAEKTKPDESPGSDGLSANIAKKQALESTGDSVVEKATAKSSSGGESSGKKSEGTPMQVCEAPQQLPPVAVKVETEDSGKAKVPTVYEEKDCTPPPEVFEAGRMFSQGFSTSEEWLKALQTMQYFQFLSSQEGAPPITTVPTQAQLKANRLDPVNSTTANNTATTTTTAPQSDEVPTSSHLASPTFLTSTGVQVDLLSCQQSRAETVEVSVQTETAIPFRECMADAEKGLEPARKKLRLDPKYRSVQKKCMQDFSEQASMLMITTKMLICHNPANKDVLESSLEVSLWQLANDMEGKFWNDISSDAAAPSLSHGNGQS